MRIFSDTHISISRYETVELDSPADTENTHQWKPLDWLSRAGRALVWHHTREKGEGASMKLGLVASAGTAWLLLKEGLSEFAFAARSHEGSCPAGCTSRTTTGSCSSGSHEVAHTAMSDTPAKGQRFTRAAMCVGRDVPNDETCGAWRRVDYRPCRERARVYGGVHGGERCDG